jgi:hypothetical protein
MQDHQGLASRSSNLLQCLGIFGAAAEAHRPSYQQYQQIAAKCNQEKKWSLRAAKGVHVDMDQHG